MTETKVEPAHGCRPMYGGYFALDYSKKTNLTDLQIECTDGSVYFSKFVLSVASGVYKSLFESCDNIDSVKMETDVKTANMVLTLLAKPPLYDCVHEKDMVEILPVMHRYDMLNDYYLYDYIKYTGTNVIVGVLVGLKYKFGQICSEWLDDEFTSIKHPLPDRFYIECVEDFACSLCHRNSAGAVITKILPYIDVDDKHLEYIANIIADSAPSENEKYLKCLYDAPESKSVARLCKIILRNKIASYGLR